MRACGVAFGFLAVLVLALFCVPVLQAATPFTITASNVTIGSSASGLSNYTVSGIPMTGTLAVSCVYSGPTASHLPFCGGGPAHAPLQVQAGQTVTGSLSFYRYGVPLPAAEPTTARRGGYAGLAGGVLAAGLLLGLRFRRRAPRWLACIALAAASLAGAMTIAGCGGGGPKAYTFTMTATNSSGVTALSGAVNTTITVTVE